MNLFYRRKLESFNDTEYDEVKLLEDVKKGIKNSLYPDERLGEEIERILYLCMMYLFEFTLFENLNEYITSEEIEKYLFFLRGVTVLMEYENDDTPVNLHSINEMLPEFIEKEKTNVMVRDDNELLSYIMIGRNKASDLSFYNIHEGFLEMRMFSLDSLLFEKPILQEK